MAFRIIEKRLKEYAVYYPPIGEDAKGNRIYGEPQELSPAEGNGVRWEDIAVEFTDQKGNIKTSKAKVGVLNKLEIGGILIYGKMEDLPDPDNPMNNPGWGIIQGETNIPTLKADKWFREVYL